MVTTAGDAGAGEGPAAEGGAVGHVAVDIDRSVLTADRQEQAGTGSGYRICQLGAGDLPAESGGGQLVRLGCGCRGEIAAAHRRCAEAWFSVRGNRRCEICGENAANITGWGGGGKEFMRKWHEMASVDGESSPKASGLCRTQSFCNFLLACLIILLVASWFFHNRIV